jgi:hypothetical protein
MYEQELRLMSVLSRFHGGRMDTFQQRMFNQKAVFMLSRIGVPDLDYPFNWYVRGPYSPELTFQLYESQAMLDHIEKGDIAPILKPQDERPFLSFSGLLQDLKNIDPETELELKMEMIASIIYLAEQIPAGKDKPTVIREAIPRLKEHFKDWNINEYLSIASKYYRL